MWISLCQDMKMEAWSQNLVSPVPSPGLRAYGVGYRQTLAQIQEKGKPNSFGVPDRDAILMHDRHRRYGLHLPGR